MTLGLVLGILIGIAISAVWNLILRVIVRTVPGIHGEVDAAPVVRIGPFLGKKDSVKRKPKSHTDEEVWKRENTI
tara:strand:- start:4976 stop:5200 length:225 start_codon:yes stop_codon:yes gene_type:complete